MLVATDLKIPPTPFNKGGLSVEKNGDGYLIKYFSYAAEKL